MPQVTECKVSTITVSGRKKRVLHYVNHQTKTKKILIVGKRGGISYKSPNSKTRRYMRTTCKNTKCSATFWNEVDRLSRKKQ